MNADVCIWGPIGPWFSTKGKGVTGPGLRQRRWVDLEDDVLTESIQWCIDEQLKVGVTHPKVFTYTEGIYVPLGMKTRVGKNLAGGGTMFYYIIVSDEQVLTQEQAEAIVLEVVKEQNEPGTESGGAGPTDGPVASTPAEQGTPGN